MVIDRVHGLHATGVSMNDRFTLMASEAPVAVPIRQRRFAAVSNFCTQNLNIRDKNLIEQIARKLEYQTKRNALRSYYGNQWGRAQRSNSESRVTGLRRSNSFGNLSQGRSVKSRLDWRWSNGDISRSASLSNLSGGSWGGRSLRGFRKRGGGQRALRGRFRGGRQSMGRVNRVPRAKNTPFQTGGQHQRGQAIRGRGRGANVQWNQPQKPMFTKEELDAQLEQYMAGTKAALDRELDVYMKNAAEI